MTKCMKVSDLQAAHLLYCIPTASQNVIVHFSLTQTDPDIGYKDDLDMQTLFSKSGLSCQEKVEMPANNLAFVLKKDSFKKTL